MEKVASFAGFDTLFNVDTFYDAIGRLGDRYDVKVNLVRDTYLKFEKELMQEPKFMKYSKLMEEALNKTAKELDMPITPGDFSDVLIAHTVIEPYPDAPTAVYQIKEKGYKTVLLTNHSRDLIKANLVKLGFDMDMVITSDDMEAYKPSDKFFDFAAEKIGKADKHVHIAVDEQKDIIPAQSQGWETLKVDRVDGAKIESLMDTVDKL